MLKRQKVFLILIAVLIAPQSCSLAKAQVRTIVADPSPQGNPCTGDVLTKNISFFTSTTLPSVVVGRGEYTCSAQGGLMLTRSIGDISGPWVTTTIASGGDHYERAKPYTYKGDTYPGLITSEGLQTKWYYNPLNWNGDVTQPWPFGIVHPSRPCHDMHLVDIDGDGELDVVCSSTSLRDTGSYIAYFNSYDNWEDHDDVVRAGDGIAVVLINGIWDIASAHDGSTWLYVNPRTFGQDARTGAWRGIPIGPGNEGNSLEGGMLNGRPVIYEASNELEDGSVWTQGLVVLQPVQSNPFTLPWKLTEIDSSYRDVHQLDAMIDPQGAAAYNSTGSPVLPTFVNGVIVGEEEQASSTCNVDGLNDHPNVAGCRVTYFANHGGNAFTPLLLSELGTQNQSVTLYGGQYAVAGANHQVYGGYPDLQIWLFQP